MCERFDRIVFTAFIAFIVFALARTAGAADTVYRADKVVLFAIDGVTWEDILAARTPNLGRLVSQGASGVLSPVTAGAKSDGEMASYYLSINAMSKEQQWMEGVFTEPVNASGAEPLYPAVMGRADDYQEKIDGRKVLFTLGLSGDTFDVWKVKTAVIGNADTKLFKTFPDGTGFAPGAHREIVYTVINRAGTVQLAAIGSEVVEAAPGSPWGVRTSNGAVLKYFKRAYFSADYIAVMHGDAYRALSYPAAGKKELDAALARADSLLGDILGVVDTRRTAVIVLAPAGPRAADPARFHKQLTPIVITGPGVPHGLLSSNTTYTPGLVCNMDVTPTVLEFLGLSPPAQAVGAPMKFIPFKGDSAALAATINKRSLDANRFRGPAMVGYGAFVVLPIFIVIVMFIAPGLKKAEPLTMSIRAINLAMLIYPAACLISTFMFEPGGGNFRAFLAASFGISAAVAALIAFFFHGRPLAALCAALWTLPAVICIDIFAKTGFCAFSVFGQSFIIGKRFYGMGNEYMSLFLASVIMGVAVSAEYLKMNRVRASAFGAVVMAAAVFFTGYPGLGVNTGGMLTAIAALAALVAVLGEVKIGVRHILTTILASALVFLVFVVADKNSIGNHPTHLASFATKVHSQGFAYLSEIISSKIEIQKSVLRATKWPYVFVVVFGFVIWLYMMPANRLRLFLNSNRNIRAAMYASLTAAVAGYVFNDTGFPITVFILGVSSTAFSFFYINSES